MCLLRSSSAALAAGAVVLVGHSPPARAALPHPGARFAVHDHRDAGSAWHVEIEVARHTARRLRTVVAYDARCGETVLAERVRVSPAGTAVVTRSFTASDASGAQHPGSWTLHARFRSPHRVAGSFQIAEDGCEAARRFRARDAAHGGADHGHGALRYARPREASATARSQARRLLRRSRRVAASRFRTIRAARRKGFHRPDTFARPRPGIFHLWHPSYMGDRRILDPDRPESLVYWKPTSRLRAPVLLAFMFRAPPGPRPDFAGTIPTWHRHHRRGDQMVHVWLTRGLRSAYANCLPVPELETSRAFGFEDVRIGLLESQPCPQEADAP